MGTHVNRYTLRVCHVYLCTLFTWLLFLSAGASAEGPARILRQDHLDIGVRSWDDMDRGQLADTLGRGSTGIRGSLHRADIAAHHHGHVPAADIFTADQGDIGGFDHRIRGFDRADQSLRLYHS